ncbi:isoprenyl transferase [Fibrobacterota bacterium]
MINNPPKHIAVIMDGNGRWAKKAHLPRIAGHREGTKATKRVVRACGELDIKFLTIYVFSSENWSRPMFEVNALMKLLIEKIHQEIEELDTENVSLQAMGKIDKLPEKTRIELEAGIEKTSHNTGLQLILALSYGGRQEIVDACRSVSEMVRKGELKSHDITEEVFRKHLYKPGVPDPELLIRTGGDMRISNYLLWQIAYTELYVTPTLWPDFDKPELISAIESFQQRQRRFGRVLDE